MAIHRQFVILWRNDDGTLTEWQSSGDSFTPNVYVTHVGTDWSVASIGDYNGDGRDDLVWRNDLDGMFTIWESTGDSFTPNVFVGGVPTDWTLTSNQYHVPDRMDLLGGIAPVFA
jgi:hypothetical protein